MVLLRDRFESRSRWFLNVALVLVAAILAPGCGGQFEDEEQPVPMEESDLGAAKESCTFVLPVDELAPGADLGHFDRPEIDDVFAPGAPGTQVCSFNTTNCYAKGKYHTGIDITNSRGTPIKASNCGKVALLQTMSSTDHGMGNAVILEHTLANGSKVYSLYAHMNSLASGLKMGATVNRGQQIGTMGGSGYNDPNYWGTHLHLEFKSAPVLHNPSGSGQYWGYTPTSAAGYGYYDPLSYINKVDIPCSTPPANPNRLDLFARGNDNALWHKFYDYVNNTYSWSAWEKLGGAISGDPKAASWGSKRLDVFARGNDGAVWHVYWNGKWSAWDSLGAPSVGIPAGSTVGAASWGSNRLDIFVRGGDNALWHRYWNGAWQAWERLGGTLSASPEAVAWSANRLDVFARGTDGASWHIYWNGKWSAWDSQGAPSVGIPAGALISAASWGANRIDLFTRGGDNALWHKYYNDSWQAWEKLGGTITSSPEGTSWGASRLDVFARGSDGATWHLFWNGTWSPWESLSAPGVGIPNGGATDAVSWNHPQ